MIPVLHADRQCRSVNSRDVTRTQPHHCIRGLFHTKHHQVSYTKLGVTCCRRKSILVQRNRHLNKELKLWAGKRLNYVKTQHQREKKTRQTTNKGLLTMESCAARALRDDVTSTSGMASNVLLAVEKTSDSHDERSESE